MNGREFGEALERAIDRRCPEGVYHPVSSQDLRDFIRAALQSITPGAGEKGPGYIAQLEAVNDDLRTRLGLGEAENERLRAFSDGLEAELHSLETAARENLEALGAECGSLRSLERWIEEHAKPALELYRGVKLRGAGGATTMTPAEAALRLLPAMPTRGEG